MDNDALTRRLLGCTDAQVWAQGFVNLINSSDPPTIDEGLMLGWFANAIEAGRTAGFQAGCEVVLEELHKAVEAQNSKS